MVGVEDAGRCSHVAARCLWLGQRSVGRARPLHPAFRAFTL